MSTYFHEKKYFLTISLEIMNDKSNSIDKSTFYVVKSDLPQRKDSKPIFTLDSMPEGFSLAEIDYLTSCYSEDDFKKTCEMLLEDGTVNNVVLLEVSEDKTSKKEIIWGEKEYKEFLSSSVLNQGRNYLLPISRIQEGSTLLNGGFFQSRLVALIQAHQDLAREIAGEKLIDRVVDHEKALAISRDSNLGFIRSPGISVDFETIRNLFLKLNNCDEFSKQVGFGEKKYFLATKENNEYQFWDYKCRRFVDWSEDISPKDIYAIDHMTMGFFDSADFAIYTDDTHTYSFSTDFPYNPKTGTIDVPEFFIVSRNEETGEFVDEFLPFFKSDNRIFNLGDINSIYFDSVGGVDSYGFCCGEDRSHFVRNIINETIDLNDLKRGNVPVGLKYYPYVSYFDLRKMVDMILRNKKPMKSKPLSKDKT